MRSRFHEYYRPSKDEFAQSFKECVFGFDANVLRNLYRYTPESRNAVIDVLRRVRDRIWLPHQAALEYQRGRITELLSQHGLVQKLQKIIDDAIAETEKLSRRNVLFAVDRLIEPVQAKLNDIRQSLEQQRSQQPDLLEGDEIFDALTDLFDGKVGNPYSPEQYQEIYKDGKERYAQKLPPGYEDKSADPNNVDQYGDLVIWRQLIDRAKSDGKPTILAEITILESYLNQRLSTPALQDCIASFAANHCTAVVLNATRSFGSKRAGVLPAPLSTRVLPARIAPQGP